MNNMPTRHTRKDMSEALGRAAEEIRFIINGWYVTEWALRPDGHMGLRMQPVIHLLPKGYYFDGNGD